MVVADLIIVYCDKCGKRIPPNAEKTELPSEGGAVVYFCAECAAAAAPTALKKAGASISSKRGARKSGSVARASSKRSAAFGGRRERTSGKRSGGVRAGEYDEEEMSPARPRGGGNPKTAKAVFTVAAGSLGVLVVLVLFLMAFGGEKKSGRKTAKRTAGRTKKWKPDPFLLEGTTKKHTVAKKTENYYTPWEHSPAKKNSHKTDTGAPTPQPPEGADETKQPTKQSSKQSTTPPLATKEKDEGGTAASKKIAPSPDKPEPPMPTVKALVCTASAKGEPDKVSVVFSEPVDKSAEKAANYSIDNGIEVKAASLAEDFRTVTLTVSPLREGTTYLLTVSDVASRTSEARATAAAAKAEFIYKKPVENGGPEVANLLPATPNGKRETDNIKRHLPRPVPKELPSLTKMGNEAAFSWTPEGYLQVACDFSTQRQAKLWQRASGRAGWENGSLWLEGTKGGNGRPGRAGLVLFGLPMSAMLVEARARIRLTGGGVGGWWLGKRGKPLLSGENLLRGALGTGGAAISVGRKQVAVVQEAYAQKKEHTMEVFLTADGRTAFTVDGNKIGSHDHGLPPPRFGLGCFADRGRVWFDEVRLRFELSKFGMATLRLWNKELTPQREPGLVLEAADGRGKKIFKGPSPAPLFISNPNAAQKPPKGLSLMWTGYMLVPVSGKYTFWTTGNGLLIKQLRIGRSSLTDGRRLGSDKGAKLRLSAGLRQFVAITTSSKAERPSIRLLWQPPGEEKTVVSAFHFLRSAGSAKAQ